MNDKNFLYIIKKAFKPFLEELGFSMGVPSISGKLYKVNFTCLSHVISISYEPGDDTQLIFIHESNYTLSDFDDTSKSPRLSNLNSIYMHTITKDQKEANEDVFKSIIVKDKEELKLLKAAKDLRLVLPKYLDSFLPK